MCISFSSRIESKENGEPLFGSSEPLPDIDIDMSGHEDYDDSLMGTVLSYVKISIFDQKHTKRLKRLSV